MAVGSGSATRRLFAANSTAIGQKNNAAGRPHTRTQRLITDRRELCRGSLTARDAAANDLVDLLQPAVRTDCVVTLSNAAPALAAELKLARGGSHVLGDSEPLPEQGYLTGLMAVLLKTELEMSDGSDASKAELIARFKNIKTRGEAGAYAAAIHDRVFSARKGA